MLLQEILPGQCPDPEPKEHDDNGGDNQEHHEGDGDTNEGSSVQAETLGDRVEIDHDFILIIFSQLELDISGGYDLELKSYLLHHYSH